MAVNNTNDPNIFCTMPAVELKIVLGVIGAILVLSLSWNIFYCVSKCCSGKTCRPRTKQSPSTRQMEDNPIYGNLNFTQTSMTVFTEDEPAHSSLSSSSKRDEQRVNSDSQSNTQDCYANLSLKTPQPLSGRRSPAIQYSDVVHLEESVKDDEDNTDAVSTLSDLYASVQTQRIKTIDTADSGEGYANHI
ncbi:hypothetical protein PAMP_017198 [Pampus punctatissimus]